MTVIGVASAAAFLMAFVLTPLIRNASHRIGYVDVPNERSSHSTPTPHSGGYAIAYGIMTGTAVAGAFPDRGVATISAAIVLLVLLAVIDRFHPSPPWGRPIPQFRI